MVVPPVIHLNDWDFPLKNSPSSELKSSPGPARATVEQPQQAQQAQQAQLLPRAAPVGSYGGQDPGCV